MCEVSQRLILLVVRSQDGGWLRKDPDPGQAHHNPDRNNNQNATK
jgi:hypothetical protein